MVVFYDRHVFPHLKFIKSYKHCVSNALYATFPFAFLFL